MVSLINLHSWFLLCFTLFLVSSLLLPQSVTCKDSDEDDVLQGINNYRQSLQLPELTKNKKAGCLADEIADQMDKKPCPSIVTITGQSPLSTYSTLVNKCKIEPSSATDGIVLPVCVPKLTSTLVLSNYTRSPFARYLNDSKYTGAGMGSKDDWMIMVLTTNTQSGSFESGVGCLGYSKVGLVMMFFLVGGLFIN
ncbi:uncharacterized GPI-anchored protein At3g06035-like [Impatiens glandulifera]|uniref:uncharacterized GPI-anchored protein At3g06035-like n=1 Tax=Impatiens glandulifera TaxID=253017 RepID=UPI001FB1065D|nr:uncharacterized GPI-anchored protein At3g06035-like [Impatiens glandulifera]